MPPVTRDEKIRLGSGDTGENLVIRRVARSGFRNTWWIDQGGNCRQTRQSTSNTRRVPIELSRHHTPSLVQNELGQNESVSPITGRIEYSPLISRVCQARHNDVGVKDDPHEPDSSSRATSSRYSWMMSSMSSGLMPIFLACCSP